MAETNPARLSFLDWLAREDQSRQQQYTKYREYYDGDHGTQLTARQRRYLQIKDGQEFNVNLCAVVVDSLAERLVVTGFVTTDDAQQSEVMWDWWTKNRMDGVQRDVHTAAVRDGDTYVLVEWDDNHDRDRPKISHEPAYDGRDGVKIHYSSAQRGAPVFASKRWMIEDDESRNAGKVRRLNLYYPNRVEKYVSNQEHYDGNWTEYLEEGDTAWPLPWLDESGQPLGIPVIHFKNQGRGYNHGRSELVDAIPVQNALNKSVIDLLAAADTDSFRIWVVTGDNPEGTDISPGAVVHFPDPQTTATTVEGADMRPMVQVVDQFKVTMGQVTRTPVSYFQVSGHRPASDTLKQEEAGLVAKVMDRQSAFGNHWEDVMSMCRKLHNVFSEQDPLDTDIDISATWKDAEIRNLRQFMIALAIKREKLGVPLEKIWAEAGYSPSEITEMKNSEEYQARMRLMQVAMGRPLGEAYGAKVQGGVELHDQPTDEEGIGATGDYAEHE